MVSLSRVKNLILRFCTNITNIVTSSTKYFHLQKCLPPRDFILSLHCLEVNTSNYCTFYGLSTPSPLWLPSWLNFLQKYTTQHHSIIRKGRKCTEGLITLCMSTSSSGDMWSFFLHFFYIFRLSIMTVNCFYNQKVILF